VAVALSGSCEIEFDDGTNTETIQLNSRDEGVLIRPGLWRVMRNFSEDCVLVVFADAHYDEDDYIRDYDAFKAWVSNK
ncbi:MAG: WxcM-like domain-containing protein, partial [Lentimonas sp.]